MIDLGVASEGHTSAATSQATTGVATQATGSTILVGYAFRSSVSFVSIADNKGNSSNYVRVGSELDGTGVMPQKSGIFVCDDAAGGAGHTATITISGAVELSVFFLEITGANSAGSLDKHAEQTDAASPFTSGATATTAQAAEMLVALFAGGGANPIVPVISGATPSGGWTANTGAFVPDGTAFYSGQVFTQIVSATGAYEAGFTESSSTEAQVWLVTIKEAGGGGGSALEESSWSTAMNPPTDNLFVSVWRKALRFLNATRDGPLPA